MRPTLRLDASNLHHIRQAAQILRDGGTVAFPTETVYGLGANALSPAAVEQIFIAKQRPAWDPLIVHIADRSQLPQVASSSPEADRLISAFWPGPLTLLLPKTTSIPAAVTAGRPLVGVRIPAHPVALPLLHASAIPIAAPSANTFGHISPTSAAHVLADLDGRIDAVLDGGETTVGLESTVAEIVPGGVIVYRPGAVSLEMLNSLQPDLGWIRFYEPSQAKATTDALPSPGVGIRHYAPRARLVLVEGDFLRSSQLVDLTLADTIDAQQVGVMLPDSWHSSCADFVFPWGPWDAPGILAQRLYTGLRQLDERGVQTIICPVPIRSDGISAAIRDRLQKAARTR